MSLVFYDRIKETTTTTGTGTITLAGAVAGYRAFSTVGNLNTCYYLIEDTTNSAWEVGLGTYTLSGTTLARSVISSSNSNSLVSFASGTKNVYLTVPSYFISNLFPSYSAPSGMRLTTESGVPISSSNRTSQGTLYYTQYTSDYLLIPNLAGTDFDVHKPNQLSLSLTLTSGKNYDVFVWNNAGTPTMQLSSAWTNDTTRNDALGGVRNVYVNSFTIGSMPSSRGIWIGTIRASGTNVTEFSNSKCFVWNFYNQLDIEMSAYDAAANWSYNSGTIRQANANAANQIEVVNGALGGVVDITVQSLYVAGNAIVGIGDNSTTAFSGLQSYQTGGGATATYRKLVRVGYSYFSWNEVTGGATTFTNTSTIGTSTGGMLANWKA